MSVQSQTALASTSQLTLRRVVAVVLGAALVAAAAQVTGVIPGTPVPFTLQPLAVLIVGGLLGPSLGASSLILYLVLGAAGLPVFTPIGLPGAARLIGPTGGYLLAYPVAAYAVGRLIGKGDGTPGTGTIVSTNAQLQLQGDLTVSGEALSIQGSGPNAAVGKCISYFARCGMPNE